MATDFVKQIQKATPRTFTAEEKIRIVLEGLCAEVPVTELCRRHGIPIRFITAYQSHVAQSCVVVTAAVDQIQNGSAERIWVKRV